MSTEKRQHISMKVELRAATEDGAKVLTGYAAVFDSDSEPIGGQFIERIAPGAFTRVLASNPDCKLLVNHDTNTLLARTTSGTLQLSQDARGLRFKAILADTQAARDLHTMIARGDYDACSFAFSCDDDEWSQDKQTGMALRTIRNISGLYDCSIVADPAYPATTVDARARKDADAWRERAEMKLRVAAVEL